MRKLLLFLAVLCMVACGSKTSKGGSTPDGGTTTNGGTTTKDDYVDLGLTSGTQWKSMNEMNPQDPENGFYTYDEAVATFGNKLPTKEQWMELVNECTWTWTGMGYRVVGYNGKSIVLSAAGYRDCNRSVDFVGSRGYYWSSTPNDSDYAWGLRFGSSEVYVNGYSRCYGQSVRLVR